MNEDMNKYMNTLIRLNKEVISNEKINSMLTQLNNQVSFELYKAYMQENKQSIHQMITTTNKILSKVSTLESVTIDSTSEQIGILKGKIEIYSQLENDLINNDVMDSQLKMLSSKKNVEDILLSIYQYGDMQYKTILHLYGEYATKQLKELIEIGLIKKARLSKFTYYYLTDYGKKYVQNYIPKQTKQTSYFEESYQSELEQKSKDELLIVNLSHSQNNFYSLFEEE